MDISFRVIHLRLPFTIQPCPQISINGIIRHSNTGIGGRIIELKKNSRCFYIDISHFILIVSQHTTYVPIPIFSHNDITGKSQLESTVSHFTIIHGISRKTKTFGRYSIGIG